MKTANLLLILFGCIFGGSCAENLMPQVSFGFVNAEVNGMHWNTTYRNAYQATYAVDALYSSATPCDKYTFLSSELYNELGYLRQSFELVKIPSVKGKFKIVPFQNGHCDESDPVYANLYTWTSDGDVLGDTYNVLTTENNFVEITSYNPDTKEIKGKFEVTFVLERRGSNHILADTLRFQNGHFHTKILVPIERRYPNGI